jgi:hypothetical protein
MRPIEILRAARDSGVHVSVAGTDLVLEADCRPPGTVINTLRRHKADIISLLEKEKPSWTNEDWQVFYDERAGIAEFDGGAARVEAEAIAFECCIVEWRNYHPQSTNPCICAGCEEPNRGERVVVPEGTESLGHTWVHSECWNDWNRKQREEAQRALGAMRLGLGHERGSTAISQPDLGKIGAE